MPLRAPQHACTQDGGVCSITGHAGHGEGVHTHIKLSYPGIRVNKIVQDGSRGGRKDWKQRPHPGTWRG